MRFTSKIILGGILFIFITSVLFIIGFSFSERRNYESINISNQIYFSQDNPIGMDIESYRVIVFETEKTDSQIRFYFGAENNSLNINPMTSEEVNKLFFPEALNGFVTANTNNDTLTIQIKFYEYREKYDVKVFNNQIHLFGFNISIHTSKVNVINKLYGLPTTVSNIETDIIKIVSYGDVLIESCKAIVIDPVVNRRDSKLTVKNSVAKTINLDLDVLGSWSVEGCDVEVQNHTGSGKHHITQHRNEKTKINWNPKNENAELNIKVPGDSIQIVFQ